ncbi:EXOC7 isoform 15, partial [Pan troglodytes]
SGVPYSPAIPNKRKDTPTKKPVKRPGCPGWADA